MDVEWAMRHENISPTDLADPHRNHADCLSITQIAPPARQIDADLFAGGEGFIMWSVENVECGVLNESRWMLNGFIMGSMGRRGCAFTVQKVITVSKKERQWGVWKRKKSYLCCKKGAPITARHDDRQGGRGRGTSSGSMAWLNPMTFLDPMT